MLTREWGPGTRFLRSAWCVNRRAGADGGKEPGAGAAGGGLAREAERGKRVARMDTRCKHPRAGGCLAALRWCTSPGRSSKADRPRHAPTREAFRRNAAAPSLKVFHHCLARADQRLRRGHRHAALPAAAAGGSSTTPAARRGSGRLPLRQPQRRLWWRGRRRRRKREARRAVASTRARSVAL